MMTREHYDAIQQQYAEQVMANAQQAMPTTGTGSVSFSPLPEQVRGGTHGDYTLTAKVARDIRNALSCGPAERSAVQDESLTMIATKLARIVCGDPNCYDHWSDIRGYSQLVLDRLSIPK